MRTEPVPRQRPPAVPPIVRPPASLQPAPSAGDGPEALRAQLAAIRATLAVLAEHGAALQPSKAASYLDAIERAAEPYLRGLSEADAQLFTGHAATWLRARYAGWAARGLAWTHAGRRYYAECALPHRNARSPSAAAAARRTAYEAGREAASRARRPAAPRPPKRPA